MKTSACLCENPDKHEKTRKNTKTAKTQYINRRKSTKIHENHKIAEIHLKKHEKTRKPTKTTKNSEHHETQRKPVKAESCTPVKNVKAVKRENHTPESVKT